MKFIKQTLICIVLLVCSCSKKNDPAPPPCLLSKVTSATTVSGQSIITIQDTFEYDSDYKLKTITESYSGTGAASTTVWTYSYANGRVSGVTETSTGSTSTTVSSTFTYDNGRLSKVAYTSGSNTVTSTYTFDQQGNLTTWNFVSADKGTPISTTSYTFTYNGGNVVSSTVTTSSSTSSGVVTTTGNYTYGNFDNNSRPYSLVAKAMGLPVFVAGAVGAVGSMLGANNPGTLSIGGDKGVPASNFTYTYEYNSRGYPTKMTSAQANSTLISNALFEYTNCN